MADQINVNAIANTLQTKVDLPDGVSQGHSDAIRRIEGVKDARQYTVPIESALNEIRNGNIKEFTKREMHKRICYVVAEDNADKTKIESEIKNMPNYFADYDTTVTFITAEELKANHSGIPHGGFVIRGGDTGWNEENKHIIEYSLKLDSNPEFTASVIVAYARAAYRMKQEGATGCKTVFDIAPAYMSALSGEELRKSMLQSFDIIPHPLPQNEKSWNCEMDNEKAGSSYASSL